MVVWEMNDPVETLEFNSLYEQLDLSKAGRPVYVTDDQGTLQGAILNGERAQHPLMVDELVPLLELAVDGDPSTEPN